MGRAQTEWPQGSVVYSQQGIHGQWRPDCSGFVAMCWNLLTGWGGPSTVTLVTDNWVKSITWSQLKAGDAIGKLGVGTDGDNGHIVLFDSWEYPDGATSENARYFGWEMTPPAGPVLRLIRYPYDGDRGYLPWRYVNIIDAPEEDMRQLVIVKSLDDEQLWLSDLMTRRRIAQSDVADILYVADQVGQPVYHGGNVWEAANLDAFGQDLTPAPSDGESVMAAAQLIADAIDRTIGD